LLYEDDVKNAVSKFLTGLGYQQKKMARLSEHAPDIILLIPSGRKELWIESKGETSSSANTSRYGKPFDTNQKSDHFGRALLKGLQWTSGDTGVLAGIAVPADPVDVDLVNSVGLALKKLGISVFLVHEGGQVDAPLGLPR
jgi:hypothetical protein